MTRAISKTTKTVAKKPNAKATKAPTTKSTKKHASVAKPTAKESKPASKKLSQISRDPDPRQSKESMNCIAMVESMEVQGL